MDLFGETPEAARMRRIGPEQVDVEQRKLDTLIRSVEHLRDHPLMPDLARAATEAQSRIQRIAMMQDMPGSEALVQQGWQEVGMLYNQATELRGSMLGDGVRTVMGIGEGTPLKDGMVGQLRDAFSIGGPGAARNEAMESVVRMLEPYAKGLSINPNDVQFNRPLQDNIFFSRDQSGRLFVNVRTVTLAYEALDQVQRSIISQINPEQQQVLHGMRLALAQAEAIDPVRSDIARRYRLANANRGASEMKAVRVVTAIGASFITGMGLVMGLKNGGEFTWPTFMWAGIAALAVNPDLLKDPAFRTLRKLEYFSNPKMQAVLRQVDPADAPAAIEELHGLRTRKRQQLDILLGSQTFSRTQLERLVGATDSPLLRVMDKVPAPDRTLVLHTLLGNGSRAQSQVVSAMVRNRNNVRPSFDTNPMPMATPFGVGMAYAGSATPPSPWYLTRSGIAPVYAPAAMPGGRLPQPHPTLDLTQFVPQQYVAPAYASGGQTQTGWQLINTPPMQAAPSPFAFSVGSTPMIPIRPQVNPNLLLASLLGRSAPYRNFSYPRGHRVFYGGPVNYVWSGRPLRLPVQPITGLPVKSVNPLLSRGSRGFPTIYPGGAVTPNTGPRPPAPGWPRPHG